MQKIQKLSPLIFIPINIYCCVLNKKILYVCECMAMCPHLYIFISLLYYNININLALNSIFLCIISILDYRISIINQKVMDIIHDLFSLNTLLHVTKYSNKLKLLIFLFIFYYFTFSYIYQNDDSDLVKIIENIIFIISLFTIVTK